MSLKGLKNKASEALASIPEAREPREERPMRATTSPGATALMQPTIDALNERAKEAEAKVADYEKKLAKSVTELPVEALVMKDTRKRRLTSEQFEELKGNLAQNALVHPISVKALADGRYEVVSGHNRVEAFRALGRVTIPVSVIDLEDVHVDRASFYANLLQPSLPDYEKYLGFKAERERTGKPQRQMAHEAGVAEAVISSLFQFEHLPAKALEIIEQHPTVIGWPCAAQLARLAQSGREARVVEAVELLATGKLTQQAAIAYAKRMTDPTASRTSSIEPQRIRSGKAEYCRYTGRGMSIRIDFKDEGERIDAEAAIRQLLEERASRKLPT